MRHLRPPNQRPSHESPPARRFLALLTAIGLAFLTAVALPVAAQAAPNPAIEVGDVTLENATSPGEQLTVGDTATVSGSWDASAANPQPGDTFTITLPPEFEFPSAVPFQLLGEDGTVWGNCLTDPATGVTTCELTAAVTERPLEVKGVFGFDVRAIAATTEDDVVFDLNGVDTPVDLPGTGGIDDGIELPDEVSKSGVMNANNWSMTWTVDIPGASIVAAGGSTVTLHDTLGAGHQLCDPTGLTVQTVRGDTVVNVTDLVTTAPVPGATEFDIVLTAPAGGFDPNVTYRLTYQTCTPEGEIDPAGTSYTNSAQIEGWGEAGQGIGTVQNRAWHTDLTKSGSVLGGADRNGKVRWTITIPGDELVGDGGFSLTDTLTGAHEVCADTISGIQIVEQYGPNPGSTPGLRTNITSQLTAAVVSSSATGFKVDFTIADGSDLEFKGSDWRYIVTYTTCVTTDGLPEGGEAFSNEAAVNALTAGYETSVPARTDRKSGGINTTAKTVDGVAHLPQTTLTWTIVVPGERLVDVDGALTVTDTISASQQVCAAGDPTGGTAAQLGLTVEARDQIGGGGLTTVDLTSSVTADAEGNDLTFTIPEPTLAQPGGGTATGWSREYQYVITYTTCTASGAMDAPGTAYGNDAEVAGKSYTASATQNNRGSGTGQGVTRGSVGISKLVTGAGADLVPAGTTFTVHVKEIDPTGTTQIEYDLQVPLDGEPVSGPNPRGTGWTIELSEPTFPSVPGVTFGAPQFAESTGVTVNEDGSVATVALTPDANIAVSLTNTALLGSISLTKEVTGPAAGLVDPDLEYEVTAAIDVTGLGENVPAQPDRTFTVTAGEPYVLANLPIGAVVTFTEVKPADDDTLTWSDPGFTPGSVTVTAAHATEPATVTLTNLVSRTVGTFSLVKLVTGAEADNPAVPESVTVTATWQGEDDEEARTEVLTLPTDGTPVELGENLLVGTEVTLTETPLADGSGIAWGAPVWSGDGVAVDGLSAVVTIGRDAEATVTLTNHAATSTAGISLLKQVSGEAAGEVDPATEFPVTVTWLDEEEATQSRELTINAVEPTPLGVDLPAGTVLTITEGERPGIDTVVWGAITISGTDVTDNGDGSATVVVSEQQDDVTLVTIVNEATWAPGTFSITKSVTGVSLDNAAVPDSVTVVATWIDESQEDSEQSRELVVPTDGTPVALGEDLPHGTEVTLTEVALADSGSFTWDAPIWGGDVETREDGSVVVTIGAATVAEVTLTNNATATLGSLAITKALSGEGASLVPAGTRFPVTISWTDLLGDQQQVQVEITAGATTVVEDIPLGTPVRIVESAAQTPATVRWTGAAWSTTATQAELVTDQNGATVTVTGDAGVVVAITATNGFAKVEDLSSTGVDGSTVALGLVAVAFLGAGTWLLIRRRRA